MHACMLLQWRPAAACAHGCKASNTTTMPADDTTAAEPGQGGRGRGRRKNSGRSRGRGRSGGKRGGSGGDDDGDGGGNEPVGSDNYKQQSGAARHARAAKVATAAAATPAGGGVGTIALPGPQLAGTGAGGACLICAGSSDFFGVGRCDHPVCGACMLKMQLLYKDKRCSVCKTEMDKVAIVQGKHTKFNDVDFGVLTHEKKWNVWIEEGDFLAQARMLNSFSCPVCASAFRDIGALKKHCSSAHALWYCEVCLKNRKVFLHEQKAMPKAELRAHSKEAHPSCQYCKTTFYANDDLFKHMSTEHFTCFICEQNGVRFQYYREYANVEDHFRQQHFLCEHPECLAKKFIVFPDQLGLNAHNLGVHKQQFDKGQRRNMKKVEVNFTVNGSTSQQQPSHGGTARQQQQQQGGGRGGACYNCGEIGHQSRDCPHIGSNGPSRGRGRNVAAASDGGTEQGTDSGRMRGRGRGSQASRKQPGSAARGGRGAAMAALAMLGGAGRQEQSGAPEPEPEPAPQLEPEPAAEIPLSPAEVKQRNRRMVAAMKSALHGDAALMEEMKNLSQCFRRGQMSASDFLAAVVALVPGGVEGLDGFFDDMIDLLSATNIPVARQKELRSLYRKAQIPVFDAGFGADGVAAASNHSGNSSVPRRGHWSRTGGTESSDADAKDFALHAAIRASQQPSSSSSSSSGAPQQWPGLGGGHESEAPAAPPTDTTSWSTEGGGGRGVIGSNGEPPEQAPVTSAADFPTLGGKAAGAGARTLGAGSRAPAGRMGSRWGVHPHRPTHAPTHARTQLAVCLTPAAVSMPPVWSVQVAVQASVAWQLAAQPVTLSPACLAAAAASLSCRVGNSSRGWALPLAGRGRSLTG
jgi:hypothetical protein